jgi:hypothetical protein
MLGDPASSGPSALTHPAASLTTIPLDSTTPFHHAPSLYWRRTDTTLTVSAPRTRHLLPALGGVLLTAAALAFVVLRLSTLPESHNQAARVGSLIMLVLPCGFGLAGLFTLLPLICPPRLRVDATGATLTLPSGFSLCRRHLAAGTFEIRLHQWCRTTGPRRIATLFLRDRANHATYAVFHKYPASELADIVRQLAATLTPAARPA